MKKHYENSINLGWLLGVSQKPVIEFLEWNRDKEKSLVDFFKKASDSIKDPNNWELQLPTLPASCTELVCKTPIRMYIGPIPEAHLMFNRYCFCVKEQLIPDIFTYEHFSSP